MGWINLLNFKIYHTAIVIKTMRVWQMDTCVQQWNRTESPEIGPHKYKLMFDKGAKPVRWRKHSLLHKWYWSCWASISKKWNFTCLAAAAAAAKSLQSCPTLCDPIDSSPPGSPIPGFLEARTLERVTCLRLIQKLTQNISRT